MCLSVAPICWVSASPSWWAPETLGGNSLKQSLPETWTSLLALDSANDMYYHFPMYESGKVSKKTWQISEILDTALVLVMTNPWAYHTQCCCNYQMLPVLGSHCGQWLYRLVALQTKQSRQPCTGPRCPSDSPKVRPMKLILLLVSKHIVYFDTLFYIIQAFMFPFKITVGLWWKYLQ